MYLVVPPCRRPSQERIADFLSAFAQTTKIGSECQINPLYIMATSAALLHRVVRTRSGTTYQCCPSAQRRGYASTAACAEVCSNCSPRSLTGASVLLAQLSVLPAVHVS